MNQVPAREETVWCAVSRVPAEPGEAHQDAGEHPGDIGPRLASLQAARHRQDDLRPG
jgi:hypothetical protein